MSRYTDSKAIIAKVHASLPPDISMKDRKKAIFDAYPFGEREYHPYKMWCKAQREYFASLNEPPLEKNAAWKAELEAKGYTFGGNS
jgi:hypothetical protein